MRALGEMAATGAAVLLLLQAAPTTAASEPQQLDAVPGVPAPLAVESSGRADCSVGATPSMRVVVAPAHGTLALRHGQLRRQGSTCPGAPGYVVLYVPDADFNGDDRVTIEVSSEDAPAETLAFEIQIKGKTTPPPNGV
ncbi:MAG TPA: hypothetical protein VL358_06970 [Caulobacteraceae bacterium]|nr:hypothetical protein [Caulobacteraceae bacterium]